MSLPIELQQELELAQRARARKLGDVLDKGSLHYAALTGNLEDMETLVTAGVERGQGPGVTLNAREPYMGSMPLHLACDAGQLAAVQVSCWCTSAQGKCPVAWRERSATSNARVGKWACHRTS